MIFVVKGQWRLCYASLPLFIGMEDGGHWEEVNTLFTGFPVSGIVYVVTSSNKILHHGIYMIHRYLNKYVQQIMFF